MHDSHTIGKNGEDAAAIDLKKNGFEILERNFRCRQGELDIVAMQGRCLVFIEVKVRTRISSEAGALDDPMTAIAPWKESRVRSAAAAWLATRQARLARCSESPLDIRFDVVAIERSPGGGLRLQHVQDAI